jgi:hypothetical protein
VGLVLQIAIPHLICKIVELNLPSYAPRSITPALPQGCTPQSRVTKAHGAAIRVWGHAEKDLVLIAFISSVLRLNAVGSNPHQLRPCPGACSKLTTKSHLATDDEIACRSRLTRLATADRHT